MNGEVFHKSAPRGAWYARETLALVIKQDGGSNPSLFLVSVTVSMNVKVVFRVPPAFVPITVDGSHSLLVA
mgnify:CR=1 FL=1